MEQSKSGTRPAATGNAIELLLSMGADLVGRDPDRAHDCFREAADLARASGSTDSERRALRLLGDAQVARGDYDDAASTLERALLLAREADDDPATASCLNSLGLLRMKQDATDDALAHLREALGRTTDAPRDEKIAGIRAETLENLGFVYRETGDPAQAFLYHQEALEIRRAAGDEPGIASCRNHLGNLCYRMGRFQEAASYYELALETRRALGDRRGVASTTNNLAGTLLLQGKLRDAAAMFEESREIAKELGDSRRLASILSNMGLLRSYEGQVDEAEELHRASLEIHREHDDLAGQAHALNNLSTLAVERGLPEEAIRLADECLELWRRSGRHGKAAKTWENRGRALLELDRLSEARDAAEEAVRAATQTQSDETRVEAGVLLARVLTREGRTEAAVTSLAEATEAAERAGSPQLRALCATTLGRLRVEAGQLEEAKGALEQAARLVRGLPHPYDRARIMAEQGRLLARAGSEAAGAERLRRALRDFEVLGNVRWQVRTLADLATAVAGTDASEAERLHDRAAQLADRHRLHDILARAERPAPEAPAVAGIRAEDLEQMTTRWLDVERQRSESLVEVVDPLFAHLRGRHDVTRAALTLPGERAALGAAGFPDGRDARLVREPAEAGEQARFVLVSGGEPTGDDVGRLEVVMGSPTNPQARLVIGRSELFDEYEVVSIEAVARVASLALEGPLERLGRRKAALVERVESFEGMVGSSPAMREVTRMIEQVAPAESSVLLLGESGTGKELAARAIHRRSGRSEGPFVAINCPSIPRELIEAELFGHEKGAFTGANESRPGKVELADGGTLLLDELGDMELATQVRLLRFIEEREFQRVGGRANRSVSVRILAATSRDLPDAVERGEFREDLYYRLNVVPIRMPSLRERREDLPELIDHFLALLAGAEGERRRLSARALDRLVAHDWPGNVRELRNSLEYMSTLADGELLDEAQIPDAILRRARRDLAAPAGSSGSSSSDMYRLRPGETMEARLRDVEAALIRATLEASDWNQSAAARQLGVTETKVRNRMRQYGIRKPSGGTT